MSSLLKKAKVRISSMSYESQDDTRGVVERVANALGLRHCESSDKLDNAAIQKQVAAFESRLPASVVRVGKSSVGVRVIKRARNQIRDQENSIRGPHDAANPPPQETA